MQERIVQTTGSIFVYSEQLGRFDFGPDHPFKPERATKTYDLCTRYGVIGYPWMTVLDPEPIGADLLPLFHVPKYLELLSEASRGEGAAVSVLLFVMLILLTIVYFRLYRKEEA